MNTVQFGGHKDQRFYLYPKRRTCNPRNPVPEHFRKILPCKSDNWLHQCCRDIEDNVQFQDRNFRVDVSPCYCCNYTTHSYHRELQDYRNSSRRSFHNADRCIHRNIRKSRRESPDLANNSRRTNVQSLWFL